MMLKREPVARPWREAAEFGKHECVKIILLGPSSGGDDDDGCGRGDPNQSTEDGDTPLLLAARDGHCECVRALLGGGAAAGAVDKSGFTALELLLDSGASENPEELRRTVVGPGRYCSATS